MIATPRSVLLVSSDASQCAKLELALANELAMHVQTIDNIADAYVLFDKPPTPDILLIDAHDKDVDSCAESSQLISHIKNNSRLRYTPIIALTAPDHQQLPIFWLEQGADDFVDKNAPTPVLIARLKTQLRQKLAIDHLERTALDRDLFAAGVLQEISSMRWSIASLCRQAKSKIASDPCQHRQEIEADLAQLVAYGSKIGHYTEALIQSGRQDEAPTTPQPQDLRLLLEWLTDLLASSDDTSSLRLAWELPPSLSPVLADINDLKIVLFNFAQYLIDQDCDRLRVIRITQEAGETNAAGQKRICTLIDDAAISLPPGDLPRLFRPYSALASEGGFNLNLALVSKLLAKMGGSVFARTGEQGKGVVYVIELPAA